MSLSDYTGRKIVFIIGCPRSGTTYLQKLLATHPKVHTGWESYVFAWYLGPLLRNWREKEHTDAAPGEMRRVGLHSYIRDRDLHQFAKEFIKVVIGNIPNGDVFLEKTPEHTLWIREIVDLLPDARFINIIRDGRDVVASLLAASRTWGQEWSTHYAFSAARVWSKYIQRAESGRKLVPKENFLDVRYEDLVRDPASELRSLGAFLQLDWNDSSIHAAVERNAIQEALVTGGTQIGPTKGDYANVSETVFKYPETSFIRKGRPGSWKEDLKFYEKWQVWLFARRTMAAAGYPWKYPW
jgi:hypothetical protein